MRLIKIYSTLDEAWRNLNMGRIFTIALRRFEQRVLQILNECGHSEFRSHHFSLARNLDMVGASTAELARRAGITKQAMGEIVEQCEKLGLVKRVNDKSDRRAKIVQFNEPGVEWLAAFRNAITTAEQEMRDEIGCLRVDAIALALKMYGRFGDQGMPCPAIESSCMQD